MNTYTLQCRTTPSGHSWTLEVRFPSDKMAVDYASGVARQMASTPWFMGVDLFSVTQHIAYITVENKPTISVKHTKGAA